jgi:hypothetical protein
MPEQFMPRTVAVSLAISVSLVVSACKEDQAKPPQSEDAAALRALVNIDFPVKSAR